MHPVFKTVWKEEVLGHRKVLVNVHHSVSKVSLIVRALFKQRKCDQYQSNRHEYQQYRHVDRLSWTLHELFHCVAIELP